jgi:hypothetical protein
MTGSMVVAASCGRTAVSASVMSRGLAIRPMIDSSATIAGNRARTP